MDPALQPSTPQNTLSTMPTSSGKRSQEKAAERQRRKRERDRNASLQNDLLSAAELSRRERVRVRRAGTTTQASCACEAEKLRELGLDMGNELGVQGLEGHAIPHRGRGRAIWRAATRLGPANRFPASPTRRFHPATHGGQTFASTLLLSFSCAPLLKQHILRTLSMTNEGARAWDQWDHQRRIHYAHQAQAAVPPPPAPFAATVDMGDAQPPQANDFRARFHRSLVAPSPFRSFAPPQPSAPADGIDPHLGAEQSPKAAVAAATAAAAAVASAIDPKRGQARGEAEGRG
ncbi:hypothetical protein EDB84DRAFT_1504258 [Lactarius hengduanensis]|nr:hypothetical protein EDB84DRAFT_1504258 [Lactarius hengduanensis]